MQQRPDLTLLSTTFPERCKPEVTRDNLISFIKDQFASDQKVIAVQGAVGSGKTTLLAQFAKTYPERCFSFFAGTTLPTSSPRIFLMDMCEQMGAVLGKSTTNLGQYGTDKLEILYLDLVRQIGRHSKETKANYYFVIDGIEWIAGSHSGHSILEYLPGEPKGNVRLLISSEVGKQLSFSIHPLKIVFFSKKETEFYLDGLDLQQEDIRAIHNTCQGMPGYLAGLRRLITSGLGFSEIQERLPHELEEVFQLEWTRMGAIDSPFEKLLALLAYSSEPVTISLAHQILALPQSTTQGHDVRVRKTSFLRIEQKGGVISFVSDAYKQFVANRLNHLREAIEHKLIQHYAADPFSKQAITLLPQYLANHGNYEQLRSLVTTDYISRALHETHDGAALKKNASNRGRSSDCERRSRGFIQIFSCQFYAHKPF